MEKVYIISRYTAPTPEERQFNIDVCRYFCRLLAKQGIRPVAPHLFYTQFINDDNPEERSLGLQFGIAELDDCDGYIVVIVDGVISAGMAGELEHKKNHPAPHKIYNLTREEAQEFVKAVKV